MFIITTIITSFGMYYLLIDWKPFTKKLIKYLPSTDKGALAKDISKITKNLIYGTLLVSLVEFIIALAGSVPIMILEEASALRCAVCLWGGDQHI